MAGLDDIFATGMNGFQMLLDHAKKFTQREKPAKAYEKGKRYLKTKYPFNCTNDSPDKTYKYPQNMFMDATCKDCVDLWEEIDAVRGIGEASESLEAQYEIKTVI